jgi:tetratricopeptide (TPR) repeat protein
LIERRIEISFSEPDLPRNIQIRIGLHTGAARELVRAGRPNYSDQTINIAARIEALARGEQVLMSAQTWSNTGRLSDINGYEWAGFRLRGVDGEWTLVEAIWDGHLPHRPNSVPPTTHLDSIATVETFSTFEGSVELINESILSHKADSERVQEFYEGAKLDWDIIAAVGDIPRDQFGELISLASQSSLEMRLICITAEPGAGKSTLAWRLAAELYKKGSPIIHILDNDSTVWFRLREFSGKINQPFYLLVDDLFRSPEAVDAFLQLSPWLPLTILATSRTNEFNANRIKCKTYRFDLASPSSGEKKLITEKLGLEEREMSELVRKRLRSTMPFIALMVELTRGKGLQEIVHDSLKRLHTTDSSAYRAYEFICYAGQHGLAIPTALLERMEGEGRYHDLPHRQSCKGLIFWHKREISLRSGHPLIASIATAFYQRSPLAVYLEIAGSTDANITQERQFLLALLSSLARSKSPFLEPLVNRLRDILNRCTEATTSISELQRWRVFYTLIGYTESSERCLDIASTLPPLTGYDANTLVGMFRYRGIEKDVLPIISKWIKEHSDVGHGRDTYMRLVENYGTKQQISELLSEMGVWLVLHPEYPNVWAYYLRLLGRKGSSKQIVVVVGNARKWLLEHPYDTFVRTALLKLFERKDPGGLRDGIIAETKSWLEKNESAAEVWNVLLTLLLRLHRNQEALELSLAALRSSPDNKNLQENYLRAIHYQSDELIVRQAYADYLRKYPEHHNPRIQFARWLQSKGHLDEAEGHYKEVLARGRLTYQLYCRYGELLLKLERWKDAAISFRSSLKLHKGFALSHRGLGYALRKLGDFGHAEKEYLDGIYWAKKHKLPVAIFYTELGWLYIDAKRWTDALVFFQLARDESPDYFMNYWGIGKALFELRDYVSAATALESAIHKEPNLRPPPSTEIASLLAESLKRTASDPDSQA